MDVVYTLSFTSWTGAVRRELTMPEDRLAEALTHHPRVRRFLLCDPFRSAAAKAVSLATGRSDAPFPESELVRLHQPLRLRRFDPVSARAAERAVAAYERSMRRAAAAMGLERPAVITTHPLLAGFGDFRWAGPVTYFAWDDWTASRPHERWWPLYRQAFARLGSAGRAVCAVSARALEAIEPSGPTAIVPNGIDPLEWAKPAAPPEWFTALPGKRLLYVGSLDHRVDVDQVLRLAEGRPDCSIVLVGPMLEPDHYRPLRGIANVELRERVARREVVSLVAAADACVIPHVRNPMTEAMSPLKLYEYLAGGAPVAAVALPGIAGVDARVELVEAGGDLGRAVARAFLRGRASERERLRFISANAWERRLEQILDLALPVD